MRTTKSSLILMACVAFAGLSDAAFAASEPATAAKPWTMDNDCSWWLSAADGKSHRASIGQSSDGVVLTISDPAFATWPQEDHIKVELRFDRNAKRRVATTGWVTRGEDYAMFGLFLNAAALRKIAGATTLELRRQGKVAVELQLSATPNKAELLACLPAPSTGHSDSE
ncbi:MAG: hypothetical protein K8S25_17695 [Alphaproteobacteria bacterium]|nr:hypothetical protein [Alphaproteobacteria bacterium]